MSYMIADDRPSRLKLLLDRMVPGHFRAITSLMCLVLGVTAYTVTSRLAVVGGVEMMITGMFIADQATHLDQPNHSDPAPTGIERYFQHNKKESIIIGVVLAILGLITALI